MASVRCTTLSREERYETLRAFYDVHDPMRLDSRIRSTLAVYESDTQWEALVAKIELVCWHMHEDKIVVLASARKITLLCLHWQARTMGCDCMGKQLWCDRLHG